MDPVTLLALEKALNTIKVLATLSATLTIFIAIVITISYVNGKSLVIK